VATTVFDPEVGSLTKQITRSVRAVQRSWSLSRSSRISIARLTGWTALAR
jgi:hypothetical protein